jgi:hypothetical protein
MAGSDVGIAVVDADELTDLKQEGYLGSCDELQCVVFDCDLAMPFKITPFDEVTTASDL